MPASRCGALVGESNESAYIGGCDTMPKRKAGMAAILLMSSEKSQEAHTFGTESAWICGRNGLCNTFGVLG